MKVGEDRNKHEKGIAEGGGCVGRGNCVWYRGVSQS